MTHVKTTAVELELLTESVEHSDVHCPKCGTQLAKTIYKDGDSETCTHCGTYLWFELLDAKVVVHSSSEASDGLKTLGFLLNAMGVLSGTRRF